MPGVRGVGVPLTCVAVARAGVGVLRGREHWKNAESMQGSGREKEGGFASTGDSSKALRRGRLQSGAVWRGLPRPPHRALCLGSVSESGRSALAARGPCRMRCLGSCRRRGLPPGCSRAGRHSPLVSLQRASAQILQLVAEEYFQDEQSELQTRDVLLDLLGDVFFVVPGLVTAQYHRGESPGTPATPRQVMGGTRCGLLTRPPALPSPSSQRRNTPRWPGT